MNTQRMPVSSPDDCELSDEELEVVVGGLPRAWHGVWSSAELGETKPPLDGAPSIG